MSETENNRFQSLRAPRGFRYGKEALEMRENLKSCLKSQDGSLARQWDYVDRTGSISSPQVPNLTFTHISIWQRPRRI